MAELQLGAAIAQGVGAILSVLVAAFVAVAVSRYTSRKDLSEFIRVRWAEQQQINLHILGNEADLRVFEQIVHGSEAAFDPLRSRKMFHLFLMLNQLHHHYVLVDRKIITKSDFERLTAPTARLICREIELIEYILKERGYGEPFAISILPIIRAARPVAPFVENT